MKTVLGLSQFFHQNEPKLAALIGNIALMLAFISGSIMSLPALLHQAGIEFILPAIAATVLKYCLVGSVICKSLTKLFGTVDANGVPTTTTLQSTVPDAPVK